MRRIIGWALMLVANLVVVGAVAQPRPDQATTILLDFETTPAGPLGAPFSTAVTGVGGPAHWEARAASGAPKGPQVLTETSGEPVEDRFPLLTLDGVVVADVDVAVWFKAIGGKVDRAAGLIARFQDKNNYYVVRANALEDNVRFYKVVNGVRRQLAGVEVKIPSDQWLRLGMKIEGIRFSIFLNDQILFTAEDQTITKPGQVGLWTKADSQTLFDGFSIVPLVRP